MAMLTQLLFIVLAVSLDGFTVGMTYGLRKIHLSFPSFLIITACSGLIVFTSMTIGELINPLMPEHFRNMIGGTIFLCLGLYMLSSSLRARQKERNRRKKGYSSFIENPEIIDFDRSGTISITEAFILGFALALDAFGAGIASSFLGFPMLTTVLCIALSSGLFVYSGFFFGHLLANFPLVKRMVYIPPILLLCIGISTFFN